MAAKASIPRKTFLMSNYLFLTIIALICIFPILHVLALSFSSAPAAAGGKVSLFPVDFTLESYKYVMSNNQFWKAFSVSVTRVLVFLPLSLLLTVMAAYPLSKSKAKFKARTFYIYFFLVPMMFSGGLIPWYLVVKEVGLTNKIAGLIIPGLVQVFNVILLMNFLRNMPEEIEEAAIIDGAGPLTTLFKIILPLTKASLATISLFIIVGQWNEWFHGIILMDTPDKYPLQSYLQTIISPTSQVTTVDSKNIEQLMKISDRTFRASQIFLAMFPVLIVYPFLQKYFTKGLVMGSVKG